MSIKKTIKYKTISTTLPPTSSAHILPLGEKPEGEDQFDNALVTLENVFTRLQKRLDELEKNVKKLHETSKVLESTVALIDPFKEFRNNVRKPKDKLVLTKEEASVLTKEMEVKDEH